MSTHRLLRGLTLLACISGVPLALAQQPVSDINGHMGIGTTKPDPSAILDLTSTNAGLLLPRMTQAQIDALVNPAVGLMVFNSSTNELAYNFGSPGAPNWVSVVTDDPGSIGSVAWMLAGNPLSGGSPGAPNEFLGSTNNYDVILRSNNIERMRVASTGEVGVATTPAAGRTLHVGGTGGTANVRMGSLSGTPVTTPFSRGGNDGVVVADANGDLVKRPIEMIAPSGFDAIASGENTAAQMQVGAGASIELSGGTVEANEFSYNGAGTSAVDLDSEVAGILPVANGGTNSTATPTAGGIAYGNDTAYLFTPAGLAGQVLVSGGAGDPTWGNISDSAWSKTGNSGTTAGTHFIGTRDNKAFQIHVDNDNTNASDGRGRVMRFEPGNASPNIIGGYQENIATGGAGGATISGGGEVGAPNAIVGGMTNTISGGRANTIISGIIDDATIGGGSSNMITDTSSAATIGGGWGNTTRAYAATIGGGSNNTVDTNATYSTIGGGNANDINATASYSTIGGGTGNNIAAGASWSTIAGGVTNSITGTGQHSFIGGGSENTVSNEWSAVIGGRLNSVNGGYSTVLGGQGLTLGGQRSLGFLAANSGSNDMTVSINDVVAFGNADLWLANNDNGASALRFYEANSTTGAFPGTTNFTSFQAQAQTADIQYILPDTAGIAGDVLAVRSVAGTQVTLDWDAVGSASAWSMTGNAGTTAGINFIGTTDDEPFEIHVDEANSNATDGRGRVMRYEPNATSANIIGGFKGNSVSGGVTAATIAGGGINGGANSISSNTSTISGGSGNSIGASSINATIGGGRSNQVGASAGNGTVGGGLGNVITSGDHATISGGFNNRVNSGSFGATMSGGTNNSLSSHTSVIGGGNGNSIGTSAQFSGIQGGHQNTIGNSSFESTISGGTTDTIETSSPYSTIAGGTSNKIRSSSTRSTIGGGYDNEVGGGNGSTISGGVSNVITGPYSAIAGGRSLSIGTGSFGFNGDPSTNQTDLTTGFNYSAYFGNVNLMIGNVDGTARELRFYEPNSGSYNYAGVHASSFKAGAQAATINYTLPTTEPNTGDLLRATSVTGSGPYDVALEWVSVGGAFDGGDNVRIDNNLVVGGNLTVEGDLTVNGRIVGLDDFNELGNSQDNTQLTINGDGSGNADHLYVIGNARVTRNFNVDGDLTVGGLTNLSQATIAGSNAGVTLTATVNTVTTGSATASFSYTLPAGVNGRIIYINNASAFPITGPALVTAGNRVTLIYTNGGWVSF